MAENSDQDADADLDALFSKASAPPAKGGTEADDDPQAHQTSPAPPAANRVLVVDDSSLYRKAISAVLQQMGCEVVEAGDGKQGLELALSEPFSLIVLDVVMPGVSGLDLLKVLRQSREKTPVVMLTVKDDLPTVSQALSSGAADYLLKHSTPDEIKQRLQKHLGL